MTMRVVPVTRDNWREALTLTVHPDNSRAQQLYLSAGFESTGREIDGEPVHCLNRQTDSVEQTSGTNPAWLVYSL
jgi:hypothetical protein